MRRRIESFLKPTKQARILLKCGSNSQNEFSERIYRCPISFYVLCRWEMKARNFRTCANVYLKKVLCSVYIACLLQ